MKTVVAVDASAGVNRLADAFGPVTLASFAQNPTGAHLFRSQHELLQQQMAAVSRQCASEINPEAALEARIAINWLSSLLPIHQSLEDSLIHRLLSSEPRSRMIAEQFEREMVPLGGEWAAYTRRYPTASSIFHAPAGEFAAASSALFSRLQERFRREERDLFPVYDRLASGAMLAAAA